MGSRAWHERLFAAVYDPLLARIERRSLGAVRAALLAPATGHTIEVGAGTGANLPHLPAALSSLLLTEPSAPMRRRLTARVGALAGALPVIPRIAATPAASIPAPDASADTVICTLVLCSVPDQPAALAEIRRVLVPGGRLLLLEHVGGDGPRRRLQRRIEPAWRRLACGCHLTRDTRHALEVAGFDTTEVEDWHMPGGGLTGPALLGVARRLD